MIQKRRIPFTLTLNTFWEPGTPPTLPQPDALSGTRHPKPSQWCCYPLRLSPETNGYLLATICLDGKGSGVNRLHPTILVALRGWLVCPGPTVKTGQGGGQIPSMLVQYISGSGRRSHAFRYKDPPRVTRSRRGASQKRTRKMPRPTSRQRS